jgi:hypothetical protein
MLLFTWVGNRNKLLSISQPFLSIMSNSKVVATQEHEFISHLDASFSAPFEVGFANQIIMYSLNHSNIMVSHERVRNLHLRE